MCDLAIFLCCLNSFRIYCLEYSCLIFSLLIFPFNLLGIIVINWNLISFYCEILYSINITICIFSIFVISIVLYSTKIGKVVSNDFYKPFSSISLIAIFVFIYLLLTYSLSSYQIFKDYMKKSVYYKKISNSQRQKIKHFLELKSTWILLFLSTIFPIIFSIINIFIWVSIYYRISFQIYCSFNKEIRKELRTQKKKNKQFHELNEANTVNTNDKKKNKESPKNFVSVVIVKDRHPRPKNYSNGKYKMNQNKNLQLYKNGEFVQSDANSSERNFDKSNNQI